MTSGGNNAIIIIFREGVVTDYMRNKSTIAVNDLACFNLRDSRIAKAVRGKFYKNNPKCSTYLGFYFVGELCFLRFRFL